MKEEMYKIVVLIPRTADQEMLDQFCTAVWDAAYDIVDKNDLDFDIFGYSTPEDFDHCVHCPHIEELGEG